MSRAFLFCLGVVFDVSRVVRDFAATFDLVVETGEMIPIRAEADKRRSLVDDQQRRTSRPQ